MIMILKGGREHERSGASLQ